MFVVRLSGHLPAHERSVCYRDGLTMFYFEVTASETSSVRQRATTTELGPFVVEAIDQGAARMLIGINYETSGDC